MESKGGVELPKGTITRSHHHRGKGLLPGKRATKEQHWGPWSIPALHTYTHMYTHKCWWQAWQWGGGWQRVIASLLPHDPGVSFTMYGSWSVSWTSVLLRQVYPKDWCCHHHSCRWSEVSATANLAQNTKNVKKKVAYFLVYANNMFN